MTDYQPAARKTLQDLRGRYPDTPLLALGQTIWWDEPMKAVLRGMLDEMGLGGHMILGVHDTDYFAKLAVRQAGQSHFELMPHNDGATKDLWSAAGEISCLLGSESYPTRHDLARYHVPLSRIAASEGRERADLLNEVTEAWGWRGLVYTGSRDLIVHSLPLRDMGDSVEEMLRFGFDGTAERVVDECCRNKARDLAGKLLGWARAYRDRHPDLTLSTLYQDIYPRLFELLLGYAPQNTEVACTGHLLRLTPETASLPRFQFVDLFLAEKTRWLAAEAYNQAVAGSEIYTLDRFGLGALPFDVIVRGHGRGTLRVTLRAIHIETPEPIRIPLERPIQSVQELATILTGRFGDHVTLVGKAVALISMLAREFIFVFNEGGSGYVWRTRKMNDFLSAHGVPLEVHPILRLRYHTWDALGAAEAALSLPPFLADATGQAEMPAAELADTWRGIVKEQSELLDALKALVRPRDLLAFLAQRDGDGWTHRQMEYDTAKRGLCTARERAAAIQERVNALYLELRGVKQAVRDTERAKGDHFRSVLEWTPAEEARRAAYGEEVASLLGRRREILAQVAALKSERLALERGPETQALRDRVAAIEDRAAGARMRLVRSAILTCSGMPHTDHRPSAWWLPMVDPRGGWFRRVALTTEVYTEPLLGEA